VSYPVGARVRVRPGDPDHHTRAPRYVRGHVGEVIAVLGEWPLPDDSVRGVRRPETCYAVRFPAAGLWGSGDPEEGTPAGHTVTVDLWESYLDSP
jgi:Nitrile hydratase beta subunit, C-terminal